MLHSNDLPLCVAAFQNFRGISKLFIWKSEKDQGLLNVNIVGPQRFETVNNNMKTNSPAQLHIEAREP